MPQGLMAFGSRGATPAELVATMRRSAISIAAEPRYASCTALVEAVGAQCRRGLTPTERNQIERVGGGRFRLAIFGRAATDGAS